MFSVGRNNYKGFDVIISIVDLSHASLLSYTITDRNDDFVDSRCFPPAELPQATNEIINMIEFSLAEYPNVNLMH